MFLLEIWVFLEVGFQEDCTAENFVESSRKRVDKKRWKSPPLRSETTNYRRPAIYKVPPRLHFAVTEKFLRVLEWRPRLRIAITMHNSHWSLTFERLRILEKAKAMEQLASATRPCSCIGPSLHTKPHLKSARRSWISWMFLLSENHQIPCWVRPESEQEMSGREGERRHVSLKISAPVKKKLFLHKSESYHIDDVTKTI